MLFRHCDGSAEEMLFICSSLSLYYNPSTSRAVIYVLQEDSLWKQVAAAKWGEEALDLCEKNVASHPVTWFEFCKHRMCLRMAPYAASCRYQPSIINCCENGGRSH